MVAPAHHHHDETISIAGRVTDFADVPVVVRRYFEALNGEDWSAFGELWADAAELHAVGSRPRRGREDVSTYFGPQLFKPWVEHLDRPVRCIVAGDTVVVEVRFRGMTHAGAEVAFDAVDVFDLADGAIARLTTWYDLGWVRKQL